MSWLTLTSADVLANLAAPQVEALRLRGLSPGQGDPLPTIIADVTARVRAEVRSNRRNRVERDETKLPPELKLAATHLVLESLQARLPNLALSTDQLRLMAEAHVLLARVARGEVPIATPTEPESALEASSPYGLEVVNRRRGRVTGNNLAGL